MRSNSIIIIIFYTCSKASFMPFCSCSPWLLTYNIAQTLTSLILNIAKRVHQIASALPKIHAHSASKDIPCMKITAFNAPNHQKYTELVRDAAQEHKAPSYHALIVKWSVDTTHFCFRVVAYWVKVVFRLIRMDFANSVTLASTLRIIFAMPAIWVVKPVLIVIIVLTVVLDTTGQLQMEGCVVLAQQGVPLAFNLMIKPFVSHV